MVSFLLCCMSYHAIASKCCCNVLCNVKHAWEKEVKTFLAWCFWFGIGLIIFFAIVGIFLANPLGGLIAFLTFGPLVKRCSDRACKICDDASALSTNKPEAMSRQNVVTSEGIHVIPEVKTLKQDIIPDAVEPDLFDAAMVEYLIKKYGTDKAWLEKIESLIESQKTLMTKLKK